MSKLAVLFTALGIGIGIAGNALPSHAADCTQPEPSCSGCHSTPGGEVCTDCSAHEEWFGQCQVLGPLYQAARDQINRATTGLLNDLQALKTSLDHLPSPTQAQNDLLNRVSQGQRNLTSAAWKSCSCAGSAGLYDLNARIQHIQASKQTLRSINVASEVSNWLTNQRNTLQASLDQGSRDAGKARNTVLSQLALLTDVQRLRRVANGDLSAIDFSPVTQANQAARSHLNQVAGTVNSSAPTAIQTIQTALASIGAASCGSYQASPAGELACIVTPLFIA